MYDRLEVQRLDELLLPMRQRRAPGVCFVRVCDWSAELEDTLRSLAEAARQRGAVLEGALPNPDTAQLEALRAAAGDDFKRDEAFLAGVLDHWMPRMKPDARREFARGLAKQLDALARQGKPEGVLRNVCYKLLCWLRYAFGPMAKHLGEDDAPKVLFCCPAVTDHELKMLTLLNSLGADILLLEPEGDAAYQRRDPQSALSQLLKCGNTPFPKEFSLKKLRPPKPAVPKPALSSCTNAWMKQADYQEIQTPVGNRGTDQGLFYNAFIRVKGVKDKQAYLSELHRFYQRIQETGRNLVIVDEGLNKPAPQEIAVIRRKNTYPDADAMLVDLAANLPGGNGPVLPGLIRYAFDRVMRKTQKDGLPLNRLLNAAVYLLCWIGRYHGQLFKGRWAGEVPCFILMGGCRDAYEALYPAFLAWLPVDVLILTPDLNRPCKLSDERLLELSGENSMVVDRFPRDAGTLQVNTLAADAEASLQRELMGTSGIFRSHQFSRAVAMTLRSTYDELFILWSQSLKYRPGFDVSDETVTMPVLYATVAGVEGGKVDAYWQRVRQLQGKDTYFVRNLPLMPSGVGSAFMPLALSAVKDRRLHRDALRSHKLYPFGLLREEMQAHILDKLQLMLDRRLIRGTYQNGTEYTVVATVMSMDKTLVRMLQGFDFTRENPKLVCVSTDERGATLEDAILLTFLNLAGFDVVLFVPTGYQSIERYLNDNLPVTHQVGEYLYDLDVPNLDALSQPPQKGHSWLKNLWKRGE